MMNNCQSLYEKRAIFKLINTYQISMHSEEFLWQKDANDLNEKI